MKGKCLEFDTPMNIKLSRIAERNPQSIPWVPFMNRLMQLPRQVNFIINNEAAYKSACEVFGPYYGFNGSIAGYTQLDSGIYTRKNLTLDKVTFTCLTNHIMVDETLRK